ncbi:sugar phosphate isomerase/epimerase [Streptomyces sp. NPDC046821]|uniref:sugar phosphate isomerase/epimerase family protein n=1 Tax=Streptomyces sp. NPDC046821 TaxID=3154702 RepID=UPI00340ACC0A
MRVGTDTSKLPGSQANGAIWTLEHIAQLGLDGAFFRSPFELSATLDPAELADVAAAAQSLGLYLEVGVAKVNPFATPETPAVRALGDGDFMLGLERMIRAVTAIGITELWTATASYQFHLQGLRACDRFRTDVDWPAQLRATTKVLRRIAPVLRDTGAHLNVETHEEITSFEAVRLVEDAGGTDCFGITFDIANVVVRGEDPVAAARRVAPYTRMTHLRDVALATTEEGIGRFIVPVGRGVVDWQPVIRELLTHAPQANLSVEGVVEDAAEMPLYVDNPEWRASHTDLTDAELDEVRRLTRAYEERAEAPGPAALRAPVDEEGGLAFIVESAAALRAHLAEARTALAAELLTRSRTPEYAHAHTFGGTR